MGVLSVSHNDLILNSKYIAESLRLVGTECVLYQLTEESSKLTIKDYANDPKPTYCDPVNVNILLEVNPKAKLRKLNWLAEGESVPVVMYISNHTSSVTGEYSEVRVDKYSVIELPYDLRESGVKKFTVSDVISNGIPTMYYICKMTPYRHQTDIDASVDGVQSALPQDAPTTLIKYSY